MDDNDNKNPIGASQFDNNKTTTMRNQTELQAKELKRKNNKLTLIVYFLANLPHTYAKNTQSKLQILEPL